ncbi:MAG: hypothetical protein HOU81_06195 [Hamadaea sp.]|uniref:phosphopantetheine-binding protein n=1 Tax=Hamadaea sp. TaxID=2024425 RepID=UPI00181D6AB2|nr:phosphopantetheine-binding protein [Hamadaea sp.]NUR70390.1 hypothetical protein [Hamadaea sp.]NUT20550.1 hypothetical protein [Hamadaea sp.]
MNRQALDLSTEYVAPRDPVEQQLAELWTARLEVAPIGVHDDFFELGGDSLLAAELQLAIDQLFGVEVPTWTLFLTPTVAELAATIVAELASA